MKHLIAIIALISIVGIIFAITNAHKTTAATETPESSNKTVKTTILQEESICDELSYIGYIDVDEMINLSFKTPGKLVSIPVEKGAKISKGSVVASLDTIDYTLNANSIEAQVGTQQALLDKAKNALELSEKQYARLKTLHDSQAISDSELDQAKAEVQIRHQEVNAAEQSLEQARSQQSINQQAIADTQLTSPIDGFVVDVPQKSGEMVAAGYPVVIIRGQSQIIKISVSQKDLPSIQLGMKADVVIDGVQTKGAVSNIAQVPNSQTRTYPVEISLEKKDFTVGAVGKVHLLGDAHQGMLIPIESLQNNGSPFVYIVKDSKIDKVAVEISKIIDSKALVTGLNSGDLLVVEGMKRVQNNDSVKVIESGEE